MTESEKVPSQARPRNVVSGWRRFCEGIFGGLAKATMILVAIVVFVFSFPEGWTSIPTTKKEIPIFLLIMTVGLAGAGLLFYFHLR
jgi:hypothetical protein